MVMKNLGYCLINLYNVTVKLFLEKGENTMINSNLRPICFTAQKVLPLVYDESLSYYEVVSKVANKINDVITELNLIKSNTTTTIKDVFEEMIKDGSLQYLVNNTLITKDLGTISDFRVGYLPPADFDVDKFLNVALEDKKVFAEKMWSYSSGVSTIPLFENNPYRVMNKLGSVVSCSAFVCDCLYKVGYTDLEGDTLYCGSADSADDLGDYLIRKGWTAVYNISELKRGAIVTTRWREYANVGGHSFIYVSSTEKYDCGSTALIQSGGIDVLRWTAEIGTNTLDRCITTGFYTFNGSYPIGEYSDSIKYFGVVIGRSNQVSQFLMCEKGLLYRFSYDNGVTWTDFVYKGSYRGSYALVSALTDNSLPITFNSANPKTLSFANKSGSDIISLSSGGRIIFNYKGTYLLNFCLTFNPSSVGYVTLSNVLSKTDNVTDGVTKNVYRFNGEVNQICSMNFSQIIEVTEPNSYLFTRLYLTNFTEDLTLFNAGESCRIDVTML